MIIAIIVLSICLIFSVAMSFGIRREIKKYKEIKRKMLEEELYRAKVRAWMREMDEKKPMKK